MRKLVLGGLAALLAVGALSSSALAGDDHKVPFLRDQVSTCFTGATAGTPTASVAEIAENAGIITTKVKLKNAVPNTTYAVFVVQTPSGAGCNDVDGTITTDKGGNGNLILQEPLLPGSEDAFVYVYDGVDLMVTRDVVFG